MEETGGADTPVPQGLPVTSTTAMEKGNDSASQAIMPWPIFAAQLVYLLVLLLLVFAYTKSSDVRAFFPDPIGFVPLAIPWWGALGAVTVALFGIFFHNRNWYPSYNYWYVIRPVTGAVLGVVAYLIFVVVIDATGAKAKTSGTLVYDLAAFLVGNREQHFHDLIQRATGALFGVSNNQLRAATTDSSTQHGDSKLRLPADLAARTADATTKPVADS